MLAESHIADIRGREEFPVRRDFCPIKPIFVIVFIQNIIGKKLIIMRNLNVNYPNNKCHSEQSEGAEDRREPISILNY